ncbi:ADP-ribosyltransferase [Campylobacter sp. VBCF_06 NA8]|uniref:ADP-ribosyltransferase n=1 Tax=Campylobacter sp. VBCF_06 NA8 TaxID=2983822 RepID=UPI0022E9A9A4|nr:ADP-ribosyltransferase [Campylobacter sp. VBCF_06 NA8]MDA3046699.1 ADP-ribosyltransferase [Campylobacter sp. VBCF_06 NA8]
MLVIDDLLGALGIKINAHAKELLADTIANGLKSENLAKFGEAVIKELNATQSQIKGEKVPLQATQNAYIYDDITLSDNLYLRLREVEKEAKQIIKTHLKEQKTIKDLALKLYEGYDFKSDPLKIKKKLPKYLKEQIAPLSQIKKLKTPNLKASYMQALKAKSDEAKAKALKIAMYEKGRFYANRIAQNEANIEYMRERATEILNNDEIEVVRVKMSKTHPRADICDYHANVDLYGLGRGIYPKELAPLPPFHPFCRCRLIPKFSESAKGAKLNPNAEKEFIKSLAPYKQAQILGSKRRALEFLSSDKSMVEFYNQSKPQRYKTATIGEILGLNLRNETRAQKGEKTPKSAKIKPNFSGTAITQAEKEAIAFYTTDNYPVTRVVANNPNITISELKNNPQLGLKYMSDEKIQELKDAALKHYKTINKIFKKYRSNLDNDVILHRGIAVSEKLFSVIEKKVGKNLVLDDKMFNSFSQNYTTAYNIANIHTDKTKTHIVIFKVANKGKAFDISELSEIPSEKEALIPKNTKYKVLSIEQKTTKSYIVELEIIR